MQLNVKGILNHCKKKKKKAKSFPTNKFVKDSLHSRCHKMVNKSQRRCSVKKDVVRNFGNFTGKHLCAPLVAASVVSEKG